jgi:hypothetical protein
VLLSGFTGGPRLLPERRHREFTAPAQTVRRSPGHYTEWTTACKGGPPPNCHFGFGALLTEVALLGTIAQRTGRYLEWDPEALILTNDPEAQRLVHPPSRQEWGV